MHYFAKSAARYSGAQSFHGRPEAFVLTDAQNNTRLLACVYGTRSVPTLQREGFFTKHRFTRSGDADDLINVQRVRRGKHHCLHVRIFQCGIQLTGKFKPVLLRKRQRLVDFLGDAVDELQLGTSALYGRALLVLHQSSHDPIDGKRQAQYGCGSAFLTAGFTGLVLRIQNCGFSPIS
jgi:hypothetical protein